jgi:hypothetical protein
MKYWKQLTVLTLFSGFGFGQNLTYKVIKDQPDDVANYWVNIGLMDIGFATENPGYGLLGVSLNSVVHYKNKVGGEFTFRKYYLSLEGDTPGSNFEIGGFYNLGKFSKTRNQKVILATKKSGNKTTTSSMKVPGTIMRSFGIRAGFNTQSEMVIANLETNKLTENVNFRSSGLYAGILLTSQLNMKSHTSQYGIKGAGLYRRLYIDLLFNPIRSYGDMVVPDANKAGAIGYRIGFEFMSPEPRKVQGTAIYQKLEIGSRPWDKYYVMYSLGFNFKRKVKAMSSFKPVREME